MPVPPPASAGGFFIEAHMLRILALLLVLVTGNAYAETIPATGSSTSYRCQTAADISVYTGWFGSQEAACSAAGGAMGTGGFCRKNGGTGTALICEFSQYSCPTGQNWSLNGSTCTRPDCTAGQVRDPATGVCVVEKCKATSDIIGSTYAASASATPYEACFGGCKAHVMDRGLSKTDCKVINGQTLCKVSYRYQLNGGGNSDECTPGQSGANAPPVDNTQTPESCGQNQGSIKVDGKTTCIDKTTGKPVTQDAQTTTAASNTVTNPDGTTTKTTTITNNFTGGATTITNIYAPGVNPDTGQPSSTTVVTTGGGAGVGSGSGSGSGSGNGNGNNDASCGASGQAPCKIDETGTPTDGSLGAQKDAFDQTAQARADSITALGGSQQVTQLPWVWSPQFPTGSCQNLDFAIGGGKGSTVDICSSGHLQTARQILGWVYFMFFAIYAWHRFTGAVERR